MKNIFKVLKSKAAAFKLSTLKAERAAKFADTSDCVKTEAVQLVADASKHIRPEENIHVKMVFDEAGEMVYLQTACNLDHFTPPAPQESSTVATLVEKQSTLIPPALNTPAFSSELPIAYFKRAAVARLSAVASAPANPIPALSTADFRVIQILGRGAQGKVLLVQYQGDGYLYALKMVKKSSLKLRDYPLAFLEQDLMKELAGNLFCAQIKASFEDHDHFYLLSDFYPAGDLNCVLYKPGGVDPIELRLFCAQLVIALDELHRQRIIHRDIKPSNVLVTRDHELVIADFGLSRAFGRTTDQQVWRQREYLNTPACSDRSSEGATGEPVDVTQRQCGTLPYMAPEIYCGVGFSYAADIFALGVTFYEMLHRKLPFGIAYENRNSKDVARRIVCGSLEVNEDIHADARDLLYMMLEKDASMRPSLEQIKQHPWFASINFDELSHRERPRPLTPMKALEPSPEAEDVKFPPPYQEGEAPHPWFQWVSPNLQNRKPKAKSSRTKRSWIHQRSVSAPSARLTPRLSPIPPPLSAFFASPVIPAASPVSPAFPAAPLHSDGAARSTMPLDPAHTLTSVLLSAIRLPSFAPPQPSPNPCMLTRPCGLDVSRLVPAGGGVYSVLPDPSPVEGSRHALGPVAAVDQATLSNASCTIILDAPSRDATRVTNALPSWDARNPTVVADRVVVENVNICAEPSHRSAKTGDTVATRVDASSALSSKLAPHDRECSPWALA
ncbi:hypothetical protein BN946_scf184992.g34 [Trametes cinnabarina]|uniref:Protein kinase domain-containing protein n=1 Tax=Pycnoporus cinnabarinus TaxID=5643 RepID=A0A060S433_PYCCI|nr:hypothetical protein BN946_scf184992.g34 [Trametes cinnabarina]